MIDNPNRKMELLAPAGGWEQLEYAIRFGADAVYLACGHFGMRQRAQNFQIDEMPSVVQYAHECGVKVHVTANIVMHEEQIEELPSYFDSLHAAGVDAFIIGDMGALRLAKKHAPEVELHISTQASVSNAESALLYYELGAKRIVCAREMSLQSIASMRQKLPEDLELEAFVHGAMCMAYSGRCLISDYLTGRSALQGNCTQSCRWNYTIQEEMRPGEYFPVQEDENGSYILNSKDMNMLAHLDELALAGIDSIKIEGRNKKAFYVATVVNAYRQVLDGRPLEEFAYELETVSHRPYSTGFYFGPAHQTTHSIDYVREHEWVAKVASCTKSSSGYTVEVLCRNKFTPSDYMEVLSPHAPVERVQMSSLCHVPEPDLYPDQLEPVDVANRTMELYRFESPRSMKPNDIIRARRS